MENSHIQFINQYQNFGPKNVGQTPYLNQMAVFPGI